MFRLIKFIFLALFLLLLSIPVFIWFSLAETPLVIQQEQLSAADISRAQQIVKTTNPYSMRDGQTQTLSLSEHDLNLAVNYLSRQYLKSSSLIHLNQQQLQIQSTHQLPILITKKYLNIELVFNENQKIPEIDSLTIGSISIPKYILYPTVRGLINYLSSTNEWKLGRNMIKTAYFQPGMLEVTFEMNHEHIQKMRQSLLSSSSSETLSFYYKALVKHSNAIPDGKKVSLAEFLPPLFQIAVEQSDDDTAVEQNRALLMILGSYLSGSGLPTLVPEHKKIGAVKQIRLRLANRKDFAQHYIISASIAAAGDGQLANMIGLYKEISDSIKGSGFSFTDLAADRAGTRLGEKLTHPDFARQLQIAISKGVTEQDLAPQIKDLPEHMSAAEFKARYHSVGSPAYQAVDIEIEQRINNTPLLR